MEVVKFAWTITSFSGLNKTKLFSNSFLAGGCKWRILIFPKGNNVDCLSMYLDVADSATLPENWSRHAKFTLVLVNQMHMKKTISKDFDHRFNARESDWGCASFVPLTKLTKHGGGYLVNDTIMVEAHVSLHPEKETETQIIPLNPSMSEARTGLPPVPPSFLPSEELLVLQEEAAEIPPVENSDDVQEDNGIGPEPKYEATETNNAEPESLTDERIQLAPIDPGVKQPLPPPELIAFESGTHAQIPTTLGTTATYMAGLTNSSVDSSPSSFHLQMMSKNLLAELSRMNITSSTAVSHASQSQDQDSHETLKRMRQILEQYLTVSVEAIHLANSFDNIERIALRVIQHSASLFERTILEDLVSRLAKFKESVPAAISTIRESEDRRSCLSSQCINISARLGQGREQLSSLEAEVSRLSEEDSKLEAEIQYLITQKAELLNKKNSVAQELKRNCKQVSADLEEWRNLHKKTEQADTQWLQANEELAQANLSWKLFKENLEQCMKPAQG
ncbi:hypothetical protein Tsubulata_017764 [Turnera subulata]|uniref:MATH domain-containing protein n=1 Tax=Turnera subulata TaxID=218843 RepID=A0A9Q0J8J9_9ROSI|nr:hypothetical protein Tsubulata_017764 [Turnera subulata]